MLAVVIALGIGACAQKGFPPGGPEDRTPPTIISAFPDSGSTDVELDSAISILFSEKMNRRSVEAAFRLVPPADLESLHWERNSLTLVPAVGLLPNRTYTLLIAAGMKDGRGNRTREPSVIHFTTGDSLPSGRLEGKLLTGRMKAEGVMVWAFDSESCPPVLGETTPAGAGQADGKSEFFVGALPLNRSYGLYAHYDIDLNGEVDEGDLLVQTDSLLSVTADRPRLSGIEIYLVADDEPGKITGTVVDSALVAVGFVRGPGDTTDLSFEIPGRRGSREEMSLGGVARSSERAEPGTAPEAPPRGLGPVSADSLARRRDLQYMPADSAGVFADSGAVLPDTTAPVRDPIAVKIAETESLYLAAPVIVIAVDVADSANFVQGNADQGGAFTLSKVPPGTFRLEIFRDLDSDRGATLGLEPIAVVERIIVRPGRTTAAGELILRWPEAVRLDEWREEILQGKVPWQTAGEKGNR